MMSRVTFDFVMVPRPSIEGRFDWVVLKNKTYEEIHDQKSDWYRTEIDGKFDKTQYVKKGRQLSEPIIPRYEAKMTYPIVKDVLDSTNPEDYIELPPKPRVEHTPVQRTRVEHTPARMSSNPTKQPPPKKNTSRLTQLLEQMQIM
jgi:hypothetical protein